MRDDRIGMHVIDVGPVDERVQRRVDARRARIQVERAVRIEADHLVLVLRSAIARRQRQQLVEIERREAIELHGADVPARALDPEHRRTACPSVDRGCVSLAEVLPPPKLVTRLSAPSRFERYSNSSLGLSCAHGCHPTDWAAAVSRQATGHQRSCSCSKYPYGG